MKSGLALPATSACLAGALWLASGPALAQSHGGYQHDYRAYCQDIHGQPRSGPYDRTYANKPCKRNPCQPIARPADDSDMRSRAYDTTMNMMPQIYTTIYERSDYYRDIDSILAGNPNTSSIKFFSATQQVTNLGSVGAIELLPGYLINAPAARDLLVLVNKRLLAHNMAIIRRVLQAGCPVDPLQPGSTTPIDGLTFDRHMVQSEQTLVGDILRDPANQALVRAAAQDINRDLNLNGDILRPIGAFIGPLLGIVNRQPMNWAKQALGLGNRDLDFLKYDDRLAIGRALVYQLHGLPYPRYAAEWRQTGPGF